MSDKSATIIAIEQALQEAMEKRAKARQEAKAEIPRDDNIPQALIQNTAAALVNASGVADDTQEFKTGVTALREFFTAVYAKVGITSQIALDVSISAPQHQVNISRQEPTLQFYESKIQAGLETVQKLKNSGTDHAAEILEITQTIAKQEASQKELELKINPDKEAVAKFKQIQAEVFPLLYAIGTINELMALQQWIENCKTKNLADEFAILDAIFAAFFKTYLEEHPDLHIAAQATRDTKHNTEAKITISAIENIISLLSETQDDATIAQALNQLQLHTANSELQLGIETTRTVILELQAAPVNQRTTLCASDTIPKLKAIIRQPLIADEKDILVKHQQNQIQAAALVISNARSHLSTATDLPNDIKSISERLIALANEYNHTYPSLAKMLNATGQAILALHSATDVIAVLENTLKQIGGINPQEPFTIRFATNPMHYEAQILESSLQDSQMYGKLDAALIKQAILADTTAAIKAAKDAKDAAAKEKQAIDTVTSAFENYIRYLEELILREFDQTGQSKESLKEEILALNLQTLPKQNPRLGINCTLTGFIIAKDEKLQEHVRHYQEIRHIRDNFTREAQQNSNSARRNTAKAVNQLLKDSNDLKEKGLLLKIFSVLGFGVYGHFFYSWNEWSGKATRDLFKQVTSAAPKEAPLPAEPEIPKSAISLSGG